MSCYHNARILKGWEFTGEEYMKLLEATDWKWEDEFISPDYCLGEYYYYGIELADTSEGEVTMLDAGKLVMSYPNRDELAELKADLAAAGLTDHEIFKDAAHLYLIHTVYY